MNRLFLFGLLPLCAAGLHGAEVSADSTRGAQVFELQECGTCHALNGVGPAIGPDLGRLADQGFTPDSFAATIWNHAPAMWTEMRLRNVPHPAMDEQQAADLFAFFYSLALLRAARRRGTRQGALHDAQVRRMPRPHDGEGSGRETRETVDRSRRSARARRNHVEPLDHHARGDDA